MWAMLGSLLIDELAVGGISRGKRSICPPNFFIFVRSNLLTGQPSLGAIPRFAFCSRSLTSFQPGTCSVNGFFGVEKAVQIIKTCEERYLSEIDPHLIN